MSEITSGRCPFWLDEGVTIYFSQELSDVYRNKLCRAITENKVLPLEVLENPIPAHMEEGIRQIAYSEVGSITEYLIESYGWDRVKSIIQQCRRRPMKSILTDLGLNYYLIEQGWKRWTKVKNA